MTRRPAPRPVPRDQPPGRPSRSTFAAAFGLSPGAVPATKGAGAVKALPHDDAGLAGAVLPFAPPASVALSPTPAAAPEIPRNGNPRRRFEPGRIPFSASSGRPLPDEGSRSP